MLFDDAKIQTILDSAIFFIQQYHISLQVRVRPGSDEASDSYRIG